METNFTNSFVMKFDNYLCNLPEKTTEELKQKLHARTVFNDFIKDQMEIDEKSQDYSLD